MSKAAARQDTEAGHARTGAPGAAKRAKLAAFLVTGDVELWPQVGVHLPTKLNFRHVDTVGDLLSAVPSDTPAVILWGTRAAVPRRAPSCRNPGTFRTLRDARAG